MSENAALATAGSESERERLIQAVRDLERGADRPIEDPELACRLADHIKPMVDRLCDLKRSAADADLLELGDAAAGDEDSAAAAARKGSASPAVAVVGGTPPDDFASLPPREQARWVFMERFVPLERHEEVLRLRFEPEEFAAHQQALDRFVRGLFYLGWARQAIEQDDLAALRKRLASCVLLFRHAQLGTETGERIPCSLETLRQQYPAFFRRRKGHSWYESQHFFGEPLPRSEWVLCDTEYLNCTLSHPERKLAGFAKAWELGSECVRQKSLLEDVYDRIVCGEALGEDLFARNCNSCTATTYSSRKKRSLRTTYTVQRARAISIRGKAGIPHWRASRRLWPAVFPSVVLS